ncbi:DNA cytosine methyltransferase [Chlorogloea sp. CCALA 695]|uniref:DNA cytosine methyltransferase n=1 Tax=Chlorogloea sp. CCALA 695 TaxID=2107693 RepID=UPI000D058423|nr:DNA cytosine methyltransferase [Chlorogloea sp. CCALA 695]PSB30126.1 hypothetical protein C7B70_17165 [Chlorogloea sp. CCALA 695]
MPRQERVLSLFSGIGGWEKGIELAGLTRTFRVTQFVEKAEYPRRILAQNFPGIPIWDDVRTLNAELGDFDIIVASPPCQPFSAAGKQKGASDNRDMFPEVFRLLRQIRPRWALIENVPGLLNIDAGRYFRGILREFAALGFDAEWQIISCAEVGGVHKRERVFIIAYPSRPPRNAPQYQTELERSESVISSSCNSVSPDSKSPRRDSSGSKNPQTGTDFTSVGCCNATDTGGEGLETRERGTTNESAIPQSQRHNDSSNGQQKTQPHFCRETHGIQRELDSTNYLLTPADLPQWIERAADSDSIPYRKERLQCLGNSVVPNQAAVVWRRLNNLRGTID